MTIGEVMTDGAKTTVGDKWEVLEAISIQEVKFPFRAKDKARKG